MEQKAPTKINKIAYLFGLACAGFAFGATMFYTKKRIIQFKQPSQIDKEIQVELAQFRENQSSQDQSLQIEQKESPQLMTLTTSQQFANINKNLDEKRLAVICLMLSEEIKDKLTELRQKYFNDEGYYSTIKQKSLFQYEQEIIEEQKRDFCEKTQIDWVKLNKFIQTMDNQKFFHELLLICKKTGIYIRLLEIDEIQEIVDYYLQQLQSAETQNPDLDQLGLRHQAELKMRLKFGVFQDMLIFLYKSLQVVCGIDNQKLSNQILKIDPNFKERSFVQCIIVILSIMNSISQASQF